MAYSVTGAAKFKFPTIVSYTALGIGLHLFYRKKVSALLKQEKLIGHHTRLRENDDLTLWLASAKKKKPPFFNVRALITR